MSHCEAQNKCYEKLANKKNCSSKRSFISSRIWLQISRSSGPSRAIKIAPPTEWKFKFTVQGWENVAEILEFVRGRTVRETLSRILKYFIKRKCAQHGLPS